ncbi:hypothetical protein M9458_010248, partial [Cirrhinus mrigala]
MANLCPPLSAGEDTFELHSLQFELEAVEKQIQELLGRQTELREQRAALESSRVPCTLAPLRETERDAVIVGDSIVRYICATLAKGKVHTHCFPGARIPTILTDGESIGAIFLHAGVNDIKLRQTEVLKRDFSSLIETVHSTSPATRIIVSGPLPTYRPGHE